MQTSEVAAMSGRSFLAANGGAAAGSYRLRRHNPGDWMFHCHILEHQAAGMTGVIRMA